jgi:HEAT repeat protein
VRGAAAIALGALRDEASVPILSAILAPETTQAHGRKARADKNAFVLRAAATALGRIKSRAGTPALISALGNTSYPDDVKREAALSLGLIGDPASYNALTNAAASNDPYLASVAQDSLKKLSH